MGDRQLKWTFLWRPLTDRFYPSRVTHTYFSVQFIFLPLFRTWSNFILERNLNLFPPPLDKKSDFIRPDSETAKKVGYPVNPSVIYIFSLFSSKSPMGIHPLPFHPFIHSNLSSGRILKLQKRGISGQPLLFSNNESISSLLIDKSNGNLPSPFHSFIHSNLS